LDLNKLLHGAAGVDVGAAAAVAADAVGEAAGAAGAVVAAAIAGDVAAGSKHDLINANAAVILFVRATSLAERNLRIIEGIDG
jgi:hypothetical protein